MKQYNLAVIGLGNFGRFLISAYKKLPQVKIWAISDSDPEMLKTVAQTENISNAYLNYQDMLKDPNIDIVCIATPPFLHAKMAEQVIASGKHFIVEKPVVTKVADAEKLISQAKKAKVCGTVNHMLRFHPLWIAIKKIVEKNIFGELKKIDLQNYASDSNLPDNHWFWDKEKSGGIWVEHSVHFWDLFSWLTNAEPKKIWSKEFSRENSKIIDRVWGIVEFPNKILASQYHSFTRVSELEYFEVLLAFEKGFVKLLGWIPDIIKVSGYVSDDKIKDLESIFPKKIKIQKLKESLKRYSCGKNYCFNYHVDFSEDQRLAKESAYQKCVEDLLLDLIENIENKRHKACSSLQNGLRALKIAKKL